MDFLSAKKQGSVLIVELKRPKEGNALNRRLQKELAQTWEELEDTDDLLVGVVHGGPTVFSIGHDREELLHGQGEAASPIPEDGMFPLNLRKPVIAAIEGPCYGLGFELALSCDLRVAGEGSLLGMPDHNLFVPYRMASVLLPRMTFAGLGLQMLLAGRTLNAEEARQRRLVNQVAAGGQALATATAAATAMARKFGSADAFKKRLIWRLSAEPAPEAQAMVREPA
ncbi:MAG: enoyl-CoA hydratase/isomerase family protein [Chloroflexi bacterium]|nr:enoyl-CoA hydratase/isomerase family protein [Chloroflexota bacterium]